MEDVVSGRAHTMYVPHAAATDLAPSHAHVFPLFTGEGVRACDCATQSCSHPQTSAAISCLHQLASVSRTFKPLKSNAPSAKRTAGNPHTPFQKKDVAEGITSHPPSLVTLAWRHQRASAVASPARCGLPGVDSRG